MSTSAPKVPRLLTINQVLAWIDSNPAPDPSVDASATDAWLHAYWFMDEDVERRSGFVPDADDDPSDPADRKVMTYVDWLDAMAADRTHPVSGIARGYLDWQQPGFSF